MLMRNPDPEPAGPDATIEAFTQLRDAAIDAGLTLSDETIAQLMVADRLNYIAGSTDYIVTKLEDIDNALRHG